MGSGMGMWEGLFMRQNSLRSLFSGGRKAAEADDQPPIPQLSPLANSVVSRCSRILSQSTERLQQCFETELADHLKQPSTYARHLLEYCSYKALHAVTKRPNYLADNEFRRLIYEMMLAWEAPAAGSEFLPKGITSPSNTEVEDDDEGLLFYTDSMNMAVQVDDKKTVGLEAFARIATACPAIADPITVHNLFDALTSASSGRLHFLIFDKYLKSLNKVLKSAISMIVPSLISSLGLVDGEFVLDVDGVMPTQPVLQHIGISAWPGRLTLTSHALYFESLGVGSYDKAAKYDLATDLKQIVKRELTGPLGARLFDKAVMYKSTSLAEPIYVEFPEFKGHARRDYWLAIIREVMNAHSFIRKFNLRGIQQGEALSLAILGIFRCRALKEAFRITPSHFKTTLAFNLAENLHKGDNILEALYNHLQFLHTGTQSHDTVKFSADEDFLTGLTPVSYYTLTRLGFVLLKNEYKIEERELVVGDIHVGVTSSLEVAVKESLCCSGIVEEACATVDQVKVEGIDTNLAVMQELLFPLVELGKTLHFLAEWEDSFKSSVSLIFILYIVYRGWIRYILPSIFLSFALVMLWNKYNNKGKAMEAFQVTPPPSKNAVEQLLTLQEAISQFEALVQAGNVVLLKLRSLLFSEIPQATEKVAFSLIATAAVLAFIPFRHLILLAFLEAFTREMPLRKENTHRLRRRMREWWVRIPAAPVQLLRPEENKRRK